LCHYFRASIEKSEAICAQIQQAVPLAINPPKRVSCIECLRIIFNFETQALRELYLHPASLGEELQLVQDQPDSGFSNPNDKGSKLPLGCIHRGENCWQSLQDTLLFRVVDLRWVFETKEQAALFYVQRLHLLSEQDNGPGFNEVADYLSVGDECHVYKCIMTQAEVNIEMINVIFYYKRVMVKFFATKSPVQATSEEFATKVRQLVDEIIQRIDKTLEGLEAPPNQ